MPRTISILLADNDQDDQDFFLAAIQKLDLQADFHCVKTGVELLQFLLREGPYANTEVPRPDVLFLDLNMPLMDGLTALKKMRAHASLKDLPAFILTTSYNLEDFKLCNQAGCHGFFTKTPNLARLSEQVRAAIKGLGIPEN